MDDFTAIMLGMFLTGTPAAVMCIAVPIRQMMLERRKRQCILEGYADYLIAADRQELAALERDFRDIVSILLGDYTDEELEVGIGRSALLLKPDSGVYIKLSGPGGQWEPPDKNLPEEARLSAVAEHLISSKDARLILPLSEALGFAARERRVARIALIRLLQSVDSSHKSLLMSSSIYSVFANPVLWKPSEMQLVIVLLETIRRIGHVQAAAFVRTVAEREHKYDEIRQLALQCMAALDLEKDRQKLSFRLLRPAANSPDQLLHPVPLQPDIATDKLVRPAEPNS